MRERARFYSTAAWLKLRALKLSENPLCECGCKQPATEVDHIIPISQGGEPLDWDNLQSLTAACHSRKTAQDQGKTVRWGCDSNGVPLDPQNPWRIDSDPPPRR